MESTLAISPAESMEVKFRNLVQEHGDRIYNLALMRSNRRHLAEDITQETFIRVYKALGSFRGESEIGTWIFRIAINVCNSTLTREGRYPVSESEFADSHELTGLESTGSAEQEFMSVSRNEIIRKSIQRLPENQAQAITLYYLNEYQYTEVAEIMQIPLNTVKSHIRRAKESLRSILKEVAL